MSNTKNNKLGTDYQAQLVSLVDLVTSVAFSKAAEGWESGMVNSGQHDELIQSLLDGSELSASETMDDEDAEAIQRELLNDFYWRASLMVVEKGDSKGWLWRDLGDFAYYYGKVTNSRSRCGGSIGIQDLITSLDRHYGQEFVDTFKEANNDLLDRCYDESLDAEDC